MQPQPSSEQLGVRRCGKLRQNKLQQSLEGGQVAICMNGVLVLLLQHCICISITVGAGAREADESRGSFVTRRHHAGRGTSTPEQRRRSGRHLGRNDADLWKARSTNQYAFLVCPRHAKPGLGLIRALLHLLNLSPAPPRRQSHETEQAHDPQIFKTVAAAEIQAKNDCP